MNNNKENRISKVIFFEIEVLDEKVQQAAIIKENGKVYIKDKETGIDSLYELLRQKKFKSLDQLKDNNYYEVLSENKLKEKYPNIYNKAYGLQDSNDIEPMPVEENTIDSYLKDVLKNGKIKKLTVKASLYAITGGILLIGGYNIGKKIIESSNNKSTINKEVESPVNDTSTTEDIEVNVVDEYETAQDMLDKYGKVSKILANSEINETKSSTLSKIWDYLWDYNKVISKEHKSSVYDTRLAHTWDEVVVSYFSYNDITRDEVTNTFDNYDINLNSFKDAYYAGFKQDVLAYTVLTESTKKVDLINSQEGKDFYKKYEDLIIKYNKNYDKEYDDVEAIVNKFHKTIREDFDTNSSVNDIESYKLSVIPIIQTFDAMIENRNFDNKLTDAEMAYFDKLSSFDIIESKINSLGLSNIPSLEEEYTYGQIKDAAITKLDNTQSYNVSETDRDISEHKEYKDKFNIKDKTNKEEQNKTSNSNSGYNQSNNSDDAGMIDDDEKEDKVPTWMTDENNQEDTNKTQDEDNKNTEQQNNKVEEVEEDTPTVTSVENDTDYNNTDDSVKNVTPDDSGVDSTNELPNPNKASNNYKLQNEIIADMIINAMANTTSSISEKGYQYVK